MERYLVEKARVLAERRNRLVVVYENAPQSGQFVNDLVGAGGKLYRMKMKGYLDFRYYANLKKLISKEGANIVHVYFAPTSHWVSIYLTICSFRNVVRTAPNLPSAFIKERKRIRLFFERYFAFRHRLLAIFVKRIICRSGAVQSQFLRFGVPSHKLKVVAGGVDTRVYRYSQGLRKKVRMELGISDNAFVIGAFCRLVRTKRIDQLIKSFRHLQNGERNYRLLVVGEGSEFGALKQLATSLSIDDSTIFLGRRENVTDLYSALDVFCSSSYAEGMSNSMLEAMASELPIIASDISPNRELIEDGNGGYLINFDNPDELKRCIELISDAETWKEMGVYNRHKVIREYSLQSRIEKELALYAEVIS